jgi:hypothetical protein
MICFDRILPPSESQVKLTEESSLKGPAMSLIRLPAPSKMTTLDAGTKSIQIILELSSLVYIIFEFLELKLI